MGGPADEEDDAEDDGLPPGCAGASLAALQRSDALKNKK